MESLRLHGLTHRLVEGIAPVSVEHPVPALVHHRHVRSVEVLRNGVQHAHLQRKRELGGWRRRHVGLAC